MRFVYDLILYVFEFLISFAYFGRMYDKKFKSNRSVFAVGIPLFVGVSVIYNLFSNVVLNLLLFFLVNLIFVKICFNASIKNAIIHSISLDAIMLLAEVSVIFISSSIFKIPTDTYSNDLIIYVILSSISKLIYLALSQILLFIIMRRNFSEKSSKQFIPLFVFPILTIASSVMFALVSFRYELSVKYQIAISVICTLFIFACIFIFIYYQMLAENESKLNELIIEKDSYNVNTAYLNMLESHNNELQMIFHDLKHHYLMLNNMEEIEDVKKYISNIYSDIENKNIVKISKNKMLDLILNKYIVICKQKNIKFEYEVKTADLTYIKDYDLSIILNNVLDNAVEAAENSLERRIEFSLRHIQDNMDFLSVINSCDAPPKQINNQLLTTKNDVTNHGFGTRIIKKHVQANNGKYKWSYDDENKEFHLTILFQRKADSDAE